MYIVKHAKEINNKPSTDIDKNNENKLHIGVLLATTSTTAVLCDNPDAPCYTMLCQHIMSCALPVVTNLLQEFVDGEESRMTPILEGGDDEDIAKMESRMTPIQEGEDDEDIVTLDTVTPQCYGCIDHVHSMSIIIYSKHIMIIIYREPCHSMQNCDLNCLNRLPMLMFE